MWCFLGVSEGKITHTLRRGPDGPVLSLVCFSYPSAQIFCEKKAWPCPGISGQGRTHQNLAATSLDKEYMHIPWHSTWHMYTQWKESKLGYILY